AAPARAVRRPDPQVMRRSIEDLRREAEGRLFRLLPREAARAFEDGAVLIDIRSEDERRADGVVPGALHHPLSVLHWRLDPAVPTHNEKLALDARVILFCRAGFYSDVVVVLLP